MHDRSHELRTLIDTLEIALLTTRNLDGMLVSRPMATQDFDAAGRLWFVTSIRTHKIDELAADPRVSVAYYNSRTYEWVSISGHATINQDRARIRELYQPDWKMWFEDEGGEHDGGPDDPRLALIVVEPDSAVYFKNKHSRPRILFELAKGMVTGKSPDLGHEQHLSRGEI